MRMTLSRNNYLLGQVGSQNTAIWPLGGSICAVSTFRRASVVSIELASLSLSRLRERGGEFEFRREEKTRMDLDS